MYLERVGGEKEKPAKNLKIKASRRYVLNPGKRENTVTNESKFRWK